MHLASAAPRPGCGAPANYAILWRISIRLAGGGIVASKREKTISYRRGVWLNKDQSSTTLALCLKQAAVKLKSPDERIIPRGNGQEIKLCILKPDKHGGFYLHLTVETPGESASVVAKAPVSGDEVEVSTTPPPEGVDFLDGDAFVYLRGNDMCICTTAVHDAAIRYFLAKFFMAAHIRKDADQFDLLKVADVAALKLIQSQGVKEIEIKAAAYEATMHYQARKSQPQGLPGVIVKNIKAILVNEHDANEDALAVTLSVRTDARRRKGIKLGDKRILALAKSVLDHKEDGDDFAIITKGGQRIGPNEIFMRSKVEIDAKGKSVDHEKAWAELIAFYNVLAASGALEQ
jgi:hypothetical protein